MEKNPITGIAISSFKSLLIHVFKLSMILFGWAMRLLGMLITSIGNLIEKIILKKHS